MFVTKLFFMKELSDKTKRIIKSGLISGFINGLIFASIMAVFDWFDDKSFKIGKFLFQFLFFGAAMGAMASYSTKKRIENE